MNNLVIKHDTFRHFTVKILLPKTDEHRDTWSRNKSLGVCAMSVQDAIEIVLAKHPGSRIDSVNDHGNIHYSAMEANP